jgi:hypothetical protein
VPSVALLTIVDILSCKVQCKDLFNIEVLYSALMCFVWVMFFFKKKKKKIFRCKIYDL